jgi:phosphoribosylanthranilate isomerase
MKIKVCGLKNPDNIGKVVLLSPDYLGFICYDQSPRYIDELPAGALRDLTPYKTGVFVNEEKETIDSLLDRYNLNAIQLHGNESSEFCREFKNRVQVLKAFGLDESFDFDQLNAYADSVDYFLFDTKTSKHGGSGKTFNWDILQKYTLKVPFFLSGGLSMDNLAEVKKIKHPMFYGVDLNSRFETEPGIKDIELLKKAFSLLRQDIQ